MALTGAALLLFVIAHLLGNLQVFIGPDAFNAYAATLKSLPELLWPARIGLLVIFVIHISVAFQLRSINRAARPVGYRAKNTIQAPASSLYMVETGIVILLFVILHLLHFTLGVLQPEYFHLLDSKGRHDVYSMLVHGFQNKAYAAGYIACMIMLGIHLSHAVSSFVQTLGFPVAMDSWLRKYGRIIAYAIALGYISIPLGVQLGILRLTAGGISI
jgi:succinate dehydrogenase / fumarate reductase cytochrome b subunit